MHTDSSKHDLMCLLYIVMPCSVPSSSQMPRSNWTERLTAPFKFGAQELVPSAVKLGSAVTLTAVMRRAAGQLGRQLLGHHMRYQVGYES
jgi:hypothetical protein